MNPLSTNKKVFIHAGPGKTGSSAIQSWLCKNQAWLSDNDIFYPSHELSRHEISSGNRHHILTRIEDKWVPNEDKIQQLLDVFNGREENTLLLTSEFFFYNIEALSKLLPTAHFIAYIRNPVDLLESNYNQGIKRNSYIQKLQPPQKIENYLWQYLDSLCQKIEKKKLLLRPYHGELYVNGSIVSDLLSVVGINKKIISNRVNCSYTLATLEFKRLINHFPLGEIEPQLDLITQGCQVGKSAYSLIQPDSYRTLNEQTCKRMKLFIDAHDQQQLIPLWERLGSATQKTPCAQEATLDDLLAVAVYIKEEHLELYLSLQSLVAQHPNLFIDNPDIYTIFDVTHQYCPREDLIDESLKEAANRFTIIPNKRGKVLFELSTHFEVQEDQDNALKFAKAALYFNPNNHVFSHRVNTLLVKKNNTSLPVSKDRHSACPLRERIFSIPPLRQLQNKTKKFLRFK